MSSADPDRAATVAELEARARRHSAIRAEILVEEITGEAPATDDPLAFLDELLDGTDTGA